MGLEVMKPYQVWILPRSGDWYIAFQSHSPVEARDYARNNVSWRGILRLEVHDLTGPLETLHDSRWPT